MRTRIAKVVHFAWRHAWGLYEMHPNRLTRRAFNSLDRAHDAIAYPGGSTFCVCRRFI